MHAKKCAICNHEQRNEIEDKYLDGVSPYQIELDYPGVSNNSVYRHVKIFGLDKKRDNSTLTKIDRLLDRCNLEKIKIDPAKIVDLLALRSKVKGEITEKHENRNKNENTNKTTIDVSKSIDRQMGRLIDAVPGLRECVDGTNSPEE